MACGSCGIAKDGKPGGCSGNCSGGCNRMNTYDWLAELDIQDTGDFDLVEISFKNGARKEFFHNPTHTHSATGDWVLVEVPGGGGFDVGKISLQGDLVRMQLKKKGVKESVLFQSVIRRANERDMEKHDEVRSQERDLMIRARAISRTLDLDMKVGDVEYQGDGRKATFYYTADGRIDFRELIRHFAKEFKVKIEMRQIGARQESSRVGGIGSCGRELCCSTWLSDFKSVSTAAARYQQLAINQAKLSGMCGRLKCCLNYELDTYLDALEDFPNNPDRLKTQNGLAVLIKTDVFKGLMIYVFDSGPEKGKFYTLGVADVKEVIAMNKRGEMPVDFKALQFVPSAAKGPQGEDGEDEDYEEDVDYGGDLVGAIELPDDKKKKKKKKKKKPTDQRNGPANGAPRPDAPARENPARDANRPPQQPQQPRGERRDNNNNGERRDNNNRDRRGSNPNRPPNPNQNQNPNRNNNRGGENQNREKREGDKPTNDNKDS